MPSLLQMAKEFIEESDWGWTYDAHASISTFHHYMHADDCALLIALIDGAPCGLATIAHDSEYHHERIGIVSKFYMRKQARKTRAAREMLRAIAAWFDIMGCTHSFATATANIPTEGKAFSNLFKKFGFTPCGEALVRGNNDYL